MSDSNSVIKWVLLLPQKSPVELFNSNFTTECLSSLIIYIIGLVFFVSLAYFIAKLIRSHISVSFFLSLLKKVELNRLAEQRRDLLNWSQKKNYEGRLWAVFNGTLVESVDGKRLYTTFDAIHFFNTHTLARGVAESRLISAISGILTAIGVLGTFMGLQFGLGSLSLDAASLQDTSKSIVPLIKGASVAFSTSVWGIIASVFFNFIEKYFEQSLLIRINKLQDKIDQLFPKILAEQALIEIQKHSRESEDTLKGLAEQIGDRMQQAALTFSEQIREGMHDSVNPAVLQLVQATKDLSERQQSGASEVLSKLIEKFISSVGSMGEEQGKKLEAASSKVDKSVESLGETMKAFLEHLKKHETQQSQKADEQANSLQKTWNSFMQQFFDKFKKQLDELDERESHKTKVMDEQIEQLHSAFGNSLNDFFDQVKQQTEEHRKNLEFASSSVHNSVELLGGTMNQFLGQLKEQSENWKKQETQRSQKADEHTNKLQKTQDEFMQQFFDKFQNQLKELDKREAEKKKKMDEQIEQSRSAWDSSLKKFLERIEQQMSGWETNATKFSQSVESLLESGGDIVIQGKSLADRTEKSQESFENLAGDIKSAAESMKTATHNLSGFSKQLNEAANTMEQEILKASQLSLSASQKNEAVAKNFDDAVKDMNQLREQLQHVAGYLLQSATTAKETFDKLDQSQRDFLDGLKEKIEELQEQIGKLMTDYAEKVETQTVERLNIWNEQTLEFCNLLKESVATMNDIMGEIHDKIPLKK